MEEKSGLIIRQALVGDRSQNEGVPEIPVVDNAKHGECILHQRKALNGWC